MGISLEILYVDIGVPIVRLPLNNRSCNFKHKPLTKLKIELPSGFANTPNLAYFTPKLSRLLH